MSDHMTVSSGTGIVRVYNRTTLALITEFDSDDRLTFSCRYEGNWRAQTPIGPDEFLKMGCEESAAISLLRMGFVDIDGFKAKLADFRATP